MGAVNGPAPAGSGNKVDPVEDIDFEPFLTERPNLPCDVSPPTPPSAPSPVTLTVTKAVVGDAPEGATFQFELDCIGFDETFSLAAGESRTTASFAANTLCSLTETDSGGAASVAGEFNNVLIDSNRSFTVMNTFPVVPEVLGTAITKTLASGSPAALGESVRFDIGVTFEGGPLRNVELVDVFEHDVLAFDGVHVGSTALACQVLRRRPGRRPQHGRVRARRRERAVHSASALHGARRHGAGQHRQRGQRAQRPGRRRR